MAKLSKEQFEQARNFMKTNARPLESALFQFEFENGSSGKVVDEIKKYQNTDGGFGHGFEPDFRCEESSALATANALYLLAEVGIVESDETVKNAITYLLNTFDPEKRGWQIVPRAVENAPRAVWWNYSEDWEWGNPSAEIIGLLHFYRRLVPKDFLEDITQYAIDYINNLRKYEQHELLCLIKLYNHLPMHQRRAVSEKLNEMVQESVMTDPEKWDSYCLQPLQVVTSPASEFYNLFEELIPLNLAFLVQQQTESGYWNPTWSWGQFEAEWQIAKEDWRGCLTLNNLKVLRSFGYVETETALPK